MTMLVIKWRFQVIISKPPINTPPELHARIFPILSQNNVHPFLVLSHTHTHTHTHNFFSFQDHTLSIWKFLGQGLNQSYNCRPAPQSQQFRILATSATYTTAHGQCRILNPLSKARDQTPILMDNSWVVSAAPQWELQFTYFFER